ncbi:MAG: hypothetical protein ACT4P6_01130 [Gemmatimonadaceae bacterium]
MMRVVAAASVSLFAANVVLAQSADRSATREMLDRGRAALNDLRYQRADSIARDVLSLGMLPRPARVEALQLIAAANYPELAVEQRIAPARSAIAQLLSLDLALTIPRELSWTGLDSLYRDVVATTYATSVLVRRENPIAGINGTALLRVRANRPSSFALRARTRDGIEAVLLDSVSGAVDTTLTLRVARDDKLILRGGEYDFIVTAVDVGTKETVAKTFDGVALVPPLEALAVPARVDSTVLRAERTRPEKTTGIVAGVLLGVATIALGKGLRASDPIKSDGETDSRYTAAGIVMIVGSIAAAWYDKGRVLDKNREANRKMASDVLTRQRIAREENLRRAAEYRASITLNPEGR